MSRSSLLVAAVAWVGWYVDGSPRLQWPLFSWYHQVSLKNRHNWRELAHTELTYDCEISYGKQSRKLPIKLRKRKITTLLRTYRSCKKIGPTGNDWKTIRNQRIDHFTTRSLTSSKIEKRGCTMTPSQEKKSITKWCESHRNEKPLDFHIAYEHYAVHGSWRAKYGNPSLDSFADSPQ